MQLEQITIEFVAEQDRLLMLVSTDDGECTAALAL